jgi:DNA modification methylase
MYFNRSNVKNNIHPASFNIELPLFFIKCLTKKDDVVLDPFMGSGTTAEAALQLGRYFVGIELEQNYIDYAEKRIASYLAIEEIFD